MNNERTDPWRRWASTRWAALRRLIGQTPLLSGGNAIATQLRNRLFPDAPGQPWSGLRPGLAIMGALFLRPHGRLTMPTLLILAFAAYAFGDMAYRNLQSHYQAKMFQAVVAADVIADTCQTRSDLLWSNCLDAKSRGPLSDQMAWAMLVSADIIDPLNTPTPSQIGELLGSDRAAFVVYQWLTGGLDGREPYRMRGVEMLVDATTLCTQGKTNEHDVAMKTVVAAYLGDLYQATSDDSRWLNRETRKALGLDAPADAPSSAKASEALDAASAGWIAPWNPRVAFGVKERDDLLDPSRGAIWNGLVPRVKENSELLGPSRRAIWSEMVPSTTEGSRRKATAQLTAFLQTSDGRLSVPDHVGDNDIVATLLGYGGLIDPRNNRFKTDFSDYCNVLSKALGTEPNLALRETTLANFERMALYIAGQIRMSPEVKQARFWLSVYTGHEQRLIFMVGLFGALVILVRMSVFLTLLLLRESDDFRLLTWASALAGLGGTMFLGWFVDLSMWLVAVALGWLYLCALLAWLAGLNGLCQPDAVPEDRDNDFDSVASSRWPARLAVAILPAIGFVGTVRGIMLSLNGANAIVWAETVNQRSSAISALSADLGLAFATTLLALLGGALLTILLAFEMALAERLLLARYARRVKEG